jgi:hypothetical protein
MIDIPLQSGPERLIRLIGRKFALHDALAHSGAEILYTAIGKSSLLSRNDGAAALYSVEEVERDGIYRIVKSK